MGLNQNGTWNKQALAQLLSSERNSYEEIKKAVSEGANVRELEENGAGALCLLYNYRNYFHPLDLLKTTELLLNQGVSVNSVDRLQMTPLAWMVLRLNHGLRYHDCPLIAKLDAKNGLTDKAMIKLDESYQEQVHKCLELLLEAGADVHMIPANVPKAPHFDVWMEAYEHKLMQTDGRWHLIVMGGCMQVSTYNNFNPLAIYAEDYNSNSLTLTHLAAWRGDVKCLEKLIQYGCHGNTRTKDGRNALHLLYHYCNKPCQLVRATEVLIEAGVNVNDLDRFGRTPIHTLLYHIFMRRSHTRLLANTYSEDHFMHKSDNLWPEIKQCVLRLLAAGADINHMDILGQTPLQSMFRKFWRSTIHSDLKFQSNSSEIVPFTYQVAPMAEFADFLLKHGAKVDVRDKDGNTPLHLLATSMSNVCLCDGVNGPEDIRRCFRTMLQHGADPNAQDTEGNTAAHLLATMMRSWTHEYQQKMVDTFPAFADLAWHGADLNIKNKDGYTVLGLFFREGCIESFSLRFIWERIHTIVAAGADPSIPDRHGCYPINYVTLTNRLAYRRELPHHMMQSGQQICYQLCQVMTRSALFRALIVAAADGITEEHCLTHQLYLLMKEFVDEPKSLMLNARLAIWKGSHGKFYLGGHTLPLPPRLNRYVMELLT